MNVWLSCSFEYSCFAWTCLKILIRRVGRHTSGTYDRAGFEDAIGPVCIDHLAPGDIVVMDGAMTHDVTTLRARIEAKGATLMQLPFVPPIILFWIVHLLIPQAIQPRSEPNRAGFWSNQEMVASAWLDAGTASPRVRPFALAYLRLTSLSVGAGPCWTWHSILVTNLQWKRSSIVGMGFFMVFPTNGRTSQKSSCFCDTHMSPEGFWALTLITIIRFATHKNKSSPKRGVVSHTNLLKRHVCILFGRFDKPLGSEC